MASMHDFYLARAEASRILAADAVLDNVRQRHLASEHAWSDLADRAGRVDTMRAQLMVTKAAERAAAALAEAELEPAA